MHSAHAEQRELGDRVQDALRRSAGRSRPRARGYAAACRARRRPDRCRARAPRQRAHPIRPAERRSETCFPEGNGSVGGAGCLMRNAVASGGSRLRSSVSGTCIRARHPDALRDDPGELAREDLVAMRIEMAVVIEVKLRAGVDVLDRGEGHDPAATSGAGSSSPAKGELMGTRSSAPRLRTSCASARRMPMLSVSRGATPAPAGAPSTVTGVSSAPASGEPRR